MKGGVPPCGVTTQPTCKSDRLRGVFGFFPLHPARGLLGIVLDYAALFGNTVCAFHDFN